MLENIPKAIQDEFTIINTNIKYPTYPDEDFQNSVLEDPNLNNYSKQNTQNAFNEFFAKFTRCKLLTYNIIKQNLHNIQKYCSSLNEKTMNYIFYFYIIGKFVDLTEKKYFKIELTGNYKKELFFDDMIFECSHSDKDLMLLYKKDFKEQNEVAKISHFYNPIFERYNYLLKSQNKIGNIVIRTIKYYTKYLFTPLEEELNKFNNIKIFHEENFFKTKINEENEIILLNIILYWKKLENLYNPIYNSAILSKNDICNLNENSLEWQNLKKILYRLVPKNAEEIKKQIIELNNNIDLGNSIMSNIQVSDSVGSLIYSGLKNYLYYKANENQSLIDSKKYQILNGTEKFEEFFALCKRFKHLYTSSIANIEFIRKIYVKKELPSINRRYLAKLINKIRGESIPVNSSHIRNSINENFRNESLPIIYKDELPDKNLKLNYVSITILHTEKLYFKDEKKDSVFSPMFQFFNNNNSPEGQINNQFRKNTIMITVHGGGFFTSSTLVDERYLRKWANNLNIPIFGINYSLAPKYPYPEALNDLYQAYMWILNHAKTELNMDIQHIILSGGSAGGNLILGLNNLLITIKEYEAELGKNIKLPELILAQYPVTYVNLKNMSNSFLLSLNDHLLNINSTIHCVNSYIDRYEFADKDPFVNLIKVNDFILDRIKSKIRIFFGTQDVLRDDSLRLLNIFSKYNNKPNKKNHIDIRGYDILYLVHAFNGLNEEIQEIGRKVIFPEIEDFINNI